MITLGVGMRWESHCGASEASGTPLDDNAGPGMRRESQCGASEASGAPLDDNGGPGMRWKVTKKKYSYIFFQWPGGATKKI